MCPSLIQIGSKTDEKNSAQTNRETDSTKIMVTWPWTNSALWLLLVERIGQWAAVKCLRVVSVDVVTGPWWQWLCFCHGVKRYFLWTRQYDVRDWWPVGWYQLHDVNVGVERGRTKWWEQHQYHDPAAATQWAFYHFIMMLVNIPHTA